MGTIYVLRVKVLLRDLGEGLPAGCCDYFVDAPLAAKDISLPRAICLTLLLLESKAKTIFGSLLEPPSTRVYADCALEGIAETTPEVLFASQSSLNTEVDQLKSELHDLEVTL